MNTGEGLDSDESFDLKSFDSGLTTRRLIAGCADLIWPDFFGYGRHGGPPYAGSEALTYIQAKNWSKPLENISQRAARAAAKVRSCRVGPHGDRGRANMLQRSKCNTSTL